MMLTPSFQEEERLVGVIQRITFHGSDTGWAILRVTPLNNPSDLVTVQLYSAHLFAGATFEFRGHYIDHPQYGRQFKAKEAIEKKPATTAALEKYLGSGLIYGVGPKTAKKIVSYFKGETLNVFEERIDRLLEVPGIAEGKLRLIKESWKEHREIRDVMMFLQQHGISTLFAVKIYKEYGNKAQEVVVQNPYQLAKDIYGIGFFSADSVAANLGFEKDAPLRIKAAIKHVLSSARDEGHCYLKEGQIFQEVRKLLTLEKEDSFFREFLHLLEEEKEIKSRELQEESCYYARSLYYDEREVFYRVENLLKEKYEVDKDRVLNWVTRFVQESAIALSEEQKRAVVSIPSYGISLLTGGPGCGKTTTTKTLVRLLKAMGKKLLLSAPTGRAAQRMSEVIGLEAKTIHRLLIWNPQSAGFKKNSDDPLEADVVIVDECSMIDIQLAASLLKAIPKKCQVIFIGDADQLPPVGAGQFFKDLLHSGVVPTFRLTEIFRQAKSSSIITFAHEINKGAIPLIPSPIHRPSLWSEKKDCLFIDSEELTKEQIHFIVKARQHFRQEEFETTEDPYMAMSSSQKEDLHFTIPPKFSHVQLETLLKSETQSQELLALLKKVHPWSALSYGFTASEMVTKLILETIPKHYGGGVEIQVLSPMVRGSVGTLSLNKQLQEKSNPFKEGKLEIRVGERIFRTGDRVIQKRNNYDLAVFNGDIGLIREVSPLDQMLTVLFDYKSKNPREVVFKREQLQELDLAYAVTIHKSQGSEFDVVIIPLLTQHFKMLYRNLIYTGLTRAKKLAVFVGSRKALAMAVMNEDARVRQTALEELLREGEWEE